MCAWTIRFAFGDNEHTTHASCSREMERGGTSVQQQSYEHPAGMARAASGIKHAMSTMSSHATGTRARPHTNCASICELTAVLHERPCTPHSASCAACNGLALVGATRAVGVLATRSTPRLGTTHSVEAAPPAACFSSPNSSSWSSLIFHGRICMCNASTFASTASFWAFSFAVAISFAVFLLSSAALSFAILSFLA